MSSSRTLQASWLIVSWVTIAGEHVGIKRWTMPPTRQRVRRPSSATSIRHHFVKSLSSRENQTPSSSRTASSNFGDTCLFPTRKVQPQHQPRPWYAVSVARPRDLVAPKNDFRDLLAARPEDDTSRVPHRQRRASRLISANATLSRTLEAASRGVDHTEPGVEWRSTVLDVDELLEQAEADDDPIVRGEAIFPDELIPGHLEFKADDSHKFWKWDIQRQNWYHIYEATRKIVWAPKFLC